jgi:hypothetical protein
MNQIRNAPETSRAQPLGGAGARKVPIAVLGLSLSSFFVVSYGICILGYLIFPSLPVQHAALATFLPGFELLSWRTFFLGLVESLVWAWYIALLFGTLYNFFLRSAS